MGFHFLLAIDQTSGSMDIRVGRTCEGIIAGWKKLSRGLTESQDDDRAFLPPTGGQFPIRTGCMGVQAPFQEHGTPPSGE